jgi:hypothetical protein
MAFLIKLGTMTIVVPTASEAVNAFDKIVRDDKSSAPIISTFDGATIAIDDLRGIVADLAKP